jgi:hypothetical protein
MDSAFEVHMLNDSGKQKAMRLADMFDGLFASVRNVALEGVHPEEKADPEVSRELALVRTHLEMACFYAKKAMANNPLNQQ